MKDNRNQEIYYKEHSMLRDELSNLKDCQVKFLTWSVTATGALLGVGATLSSPPTPPGSPYLIPLTILIPSWWIFFDKATTITRIVGYYRILEKAILASDDGGDFIGWENALAIFREWQQEGKLPVANGSSVLDYLRTASTSWAVSRASLSISHRQHIVGTLTIAYR